MESDQAHGQCVYSPISLKKIISFQSVKKNLHRVIQGTCLPNIKGPDLLVSDKKTFKFAL